MKRSLCALLALTGTAQAGEATQAGFFQPAQRHAASYDQIAPLTIAGELQVHHRFLTEENADDRREAREQRYDARLASKLVTMGEWSVGLNLESSNVEASAPIQKRSDLRLYGLAPWLSFQVNDQFTLAHQHSMTIINQEDEPFSGQTETSSRHVRQGHTSLVWHPEAGTTLGFALSSGYQKAIHNFTAQSPARYSIFGSTTKGLPALVGFEAAVLNFAALDNELHDAYSLELFTAIPVAGAYAIDSRIAYQTAAFHKASTLTAQTAGKVSFEVGARYQLSDSIQLGAAVAVESAQAQKDETYVDQKDWAFQVQSQVSL